MTSYKLAIQTFSKAPIIKFTLNHGENSIGNNQNHTIFIQHKQVLPNHAKIIISDSIVLIGQEGDTYIQDEESNWVKVQKEIENQIALNQQSFRLGGSIICKVINDEQQNQKMVKQFKKPTMLNNETNEKKIKRNKKLHKSQSKEEVEDQNKIKDQKENQMQIQSERKSILKNKLQDPLDKLKDHLKSKQKDIQEKSKQKQIIKEQTGNIEENQLIKVETPDQTQKPEITNEDQQEQQEKKIKSPEKEQQNLVSQIFINEESQNQNQEIQKDKENQETVQEQVINDKQQTKSNEQVQDKKIINGEKRKKNKKQKQVEVLQSQSEKKSSLRPKYLIGISGFNLSDEEKQFIKLKNIRFDESNYHFNTLIMENNCELRSLKLLLALSRNTMILSRDFLLDGIKYNKVLHPQEYQIEFSQKFKQQYEFNYEKYKKNYQLNLKSGGIFNNLKFYLKQEYHINRNDLEKMIEYSGGTVVDYRDDDIIIIVPRSDQNGQEYKKKKSIDWVFQSIMLQKKKE